MGAQLFPVNRQRRCRLCGEAAGGSSGSVHIVAGRAENMVFVVSRNSRLLACM
jgi:hypothetical protein